MKAFKQITESNQYLNLTEYPEKFRVNLTRTKGNLIKQFRVKVLRNTRANQTKQFMVEGTNIKTTRRTSQTTTTTKKKNMSLTSNQEACPYCNSKDVTYLECCHNICVGCFQKLAENSISTMKCGVQGCSQPGISEEYKKMILGMDVYDKFVSGNLQIEGIIACPNQPNCNAQMFFEKGETDYKQKDTTNIIMERKYCEMYAGQRCRCPECKIDFCVDCKVIPYHLGKSCEEHKQYQISEKCNFCQVVIDYSNKSAFPSCCSEEECISKARTVCGAKLPCGCLCIGSKDEKNHMPCLNPDCDSFDKRYNIDQYEFCSICFTGDLTSDASVRTECGHFFHYTCIEKILKDKWRGPKIMFGYLKCSSCKSDLRLSNNPGLQAIIDKDLLLYEKIKELTMQRIKIEGLDKDPRLLEPGEFYRKPLEFGLFKISYHMCFKCKKPYFAGLRDCRDGAENMGEPDPTKYICTDCADLKLIPGVTKCKKHGKEYILFKCKFCCAESSWFCWGTTHFCEACHKKQCSGDYLTKYKANQLPQCDGKGNCPLKIDHPPNGTEFAMGCLLCAS